ncbi:MAG: MqnA/MqnD/SBP family protein, partial [Halobacteria archaeon]|nr:MqnA/MqnD/SBP family protein [Halobacteria archaeon]
MSRKHSRREKLKIGYSPCPNDTYIFHALKHGLAEAGFDVEVKHHDVETLNEKAFEGEFDVTKISFHAFGHVVDDYGLLRSGGALG